MLKSIPKSGTKSSKYANFVKSLLLSKLTLPFSAVIDSYALEASSLFFFSSASSFTIYLIAHSSIVKLNLPEL